MWKRYYTEELAVLQADLEAPTSVKNEESLRHSIRGVLMHHPRGKKYLSRPRLEMLGEEDVIAKTLGLRNNF